jgi:hypothetical protein
VLGVGRRRCRGSSLAALRVKGRYLRFTIEASRPSAHTQLHIVILSHITCPPHIASRLLTLHSPSSPPSSLSASVMAVVTLASVLPAGFGAVLLLVIVQLLQVVGETFPIGRLRRRAFSVSFFEKHFPGVTPKPATSGYPDTGSPHSAPPLPSRRALSLSSLLLSPASLPPSCASAASVALCCVSVTVVTPTS